MWAGKREALEAQLPVRKESPGKESLEQLAPLEARVLQELPGAEKEQGSPEQGALDLERAA